MSIFSALNFKQLIHHPFCILPPESYRYHKNGFRLTKRLYMLDNSTGLNRTTPPEAKIDLSYIQGLSCGDTEFEAKMIQIYLNQIPGNIAFLEDAIARLDYADVKYMAHNLKSSMPISGLNSLLPYLATLEDQALENKIALSTIAEFETVKQTILRSCTSLQKYLDR